MHSLVGHPLLAKVQSSMVCNFIKEWHRHLSIPFCSRNLNGVCAIVVVTSRRCSYCRSQEPLCYLVSEKKGVAMHAVPWFTSWSSTLWAERWASFTVPSLADQNYQSTEIKGKMAFLHSRVTACDDDGSVESRAVMFSHLMCPISVQASESFPNRVKWCRQNICCNIFQVCIQEGLTALAHLSY